MRGKQLQDTVGGPENSQYVFPSLREVGWGKGGVGRGGRQNFKYYYRNVHTVMELGDALTLYQVLRRYSFSPKVTKSIRSYNLNIILKLREVNILIYKCDSNSV
jgi:hypothetical protein